MESTAEFQVTDADFRTVREVVMAHCGISLNDDKAAMVRARLAKQIRAGRFNSAADYLKYALSDRKSQAFAGLIDAITTNLTSFYRESDHFKFLSKTALPAAIKKKIDSGSNRLLLWSAACSSGEEPYTLAMTVLEAIEHMGPSARRMEVRILATDISTRILAVARTGIYEIDKLAKVPQNLLSKYFAPVEGSSPGSLSRVVTDELRAPIRFRHLNLLGPWPFNSMFDFVFCRNVMIYFNAPTQQQLVDRMWDCIRPGGFLFTGHSESLTRINHRFISRLPSAYEKAM